MVVGLLNVIPLVLIILQQLLYELFTLFGDLRFLRELDLSGVQHDLLFEDSVLGHVMTERLHPVYELKEDDSHREDIDLGRDLRTLAIRAPHETLRGKIPVGPDPLTGQPDLGHVRVLHDLAEPEVSDLDQPLVEQDVLGFDIIVDDNLLLRT